ncbi:helix-turn-helix domain-containing protein [Streptomyces sp. NRRL F-5630]|uniref:helix-turn-helix domain-containing protein n=1 Tax=Streptomyces sp. NRRL F-5630 TaxID=1463864 RepID=UPI003EBF242F
MPVSTNVPTMRQRRLARQLKELRLAAGLKHSDAAEILSCAESKLTRIENARSGIRLLDLRTLLDAYGVRDPDTRREIEELAKDARKKGWWAQYAQKARAEYLGYIAVEWDSTEMLTVEPFLVPGLLQTAAYTEAVVRLTQPTRPDAEVSEQAELKQERQRILTREEGYRFWCVISETVLRSEVGGAEVHREQLAHLYEAAALPSVELQVLPATSPANVLLYGPFAILRFADTGDIAFTEQGEGTIYYEEAAAAERFNARFRRLNMAALPPEESRDLIGDALRHAH